MLLTYLPESPSVLLCLLPQAWRPQEDASLLAASALPTYKPARNLLYGAECRPLTRAGCAGIPFFRLWASTPWTPVYASHTGEAACCSAWHALSTQQGHRRFRHTSARTTEGQHVSASVLPKRTPRAQWTADWLSRDSHDSRILLSPCLKEWPWTGIGT